MVHVVRRIWVPSIAGLGIPRRDRAGGAYEAYVPEPLVGRPFSIDGDVAADVADAERAIAAFDARAISLASTEALARLLLRAESVASSNIEGLVVSPQRLLRATAERADGRTIGDETATLVLANVDAMNAAIASDGDLTIERLREVHRRLLASTAGATFAGVVRTEQNWIGGNAYNPIGAAFVPPPPEDVPGLLADLCTFCNDDGLPAVAQAAIAHARFETIHPFADGNGRTGRALVYMVLRRRGLTVRATPPISLVLATRAKAYVAALDATRVVGRETNAEAHDALNTWVAFFAAACVRAVADAERFEELVATLRITWGARLAGERRHSTALVLLDSLPAAPILSVRTAAELTGRSPARANDAIAKLVAAGVLFPTTDNRRNRTFEARELIDAFTSLERQLASPAADTRVKRPTRRVPARPARQRPAPR